jgi:crotonobetainyl-CoA:carnitine CoA-transferase CaiB-like acyl-CoA transferase
VLELSDDGRFATNPQRVERREELSTFLGDAIAAWDRAPLVEALVAADVAAGPVNSVGEGVAMMGSGWVDEVAGVRLPPSPIHLGGAVQGARRPPPLLGEHTDEILAEVRDGATAGA